MKRFIYIALAVFTFAACSKNEVPPIAQGESIGFNTLRDVPTSRAANDTGNDYRVYAKFSGGERAEEWYFTDYDIRSGDSPVTPSEQYYWPYQDLDFVAFSPAVSVPWSFEITESAYPNANAGGKGKIKLEVKALDGKVDFTTAVLNDANIDSHGASGASLSFKHLMTKVNISVELGAANDFSSKYELVGEPEYTFTAIYDQAVLEDVATSTTLTNFSSSVSNPTYTTNATIDTDANSSKTAATYYVMPHTAAQNTCKIEVTGLSVRKRGVTQETSINFEHTFAAGELSLDPGKAYNMTFTLTGDVIEFNHSVADWGTATDVPVPETNPSTP